jgi:hypothetical protein
LTFKGKPLFYTHYFSLAFTLSLSNKSLLIVLIGIAGLPFVSAQRKMEFEAIRAKHPKHIPVSEHTTFNSPCSLICLQSFLLMSY